VVPRTEDSLTGGKEGPGQELTLSSRSSFFCNQVFFVNGPSSSTSLLSSVSSDQIDVSCVCVYPEYREVTSSSLWTLRNRQRRLALTVTPRTAALEPTSPCPSLAMCRTVQCRTVVVLAVAVVMVNSDCDRATGSARVGAHKLRRLLLRSSAARSSLIAILLLQPVFFLRLLAR